MIKFTIPLPPVTKKNSQQIKWRWARDKYTYQKKRVPYVRPSEAFENYEAAALWYVPKIRTITPIDYPVNVKCLFYMPTKSRVDLTNLLEAIDDVMVKARLLADDNYTIIQSHDGSRVFYDKENPRTEVYIELIEKQI